MFAVAFSGILAVFPNGMVTTGCSKKILSGIAIVI